MDRKRVPILVTTILTYLDNRETPITLQKDMIGERLHVFLGYPELEGDDTRRAIWLADVELKQTHKLRYALNNSKADYNELLPQFDIPEIASVLRLYLLELPGSFFFCSLLRPMIKLIPNRLAGFFTGL